MEKIKIKIALLLALILSVSFSYGENFDKEKRTNKDTVSALVIAPSNPLYNSISNLSGLQIVTMID